MIKIKEIKSSILFLLPITAIIIISGFVINYKKINPEPIGKLIDIGGYRLHIIKKGQGSPAVILISGAKAFSFDWYFIQNSISKFTTVCSYDRPGLAWSDAGPEPRTFNQDVYELHELLLRSYLFPPYIMVGHSLGGIIARKYVKEYPNDVVGLVLVDATSENNFLFMNNKVSRLRDFATAEQLPKIKKKIDSLTIIPSGSILSEYQKSYGEPEIEYPLTLLPNSIQKIRLWAMGLPKYYIADNGNYWANEFEEIYNDSALYKLGKMPLFVIASYKNNYPSGLGFSTDSLLNEKINLQLNMSKLSGKSHLLFTNNSGHEIFIEEPDLVNFAIKEILMQVK